MKLKKILSLASIGVITTFSSCGSGYHVIINGGLDKVENPQISLSQQNQWFSHTNVALSKLNDNQLYSPYSAFYNLYAYSEFGNSSVQSAIYSKFGLSEMNSLRSMLLNTSNILQAKGVSQKGGVWINDSLSYSDTALANLAKLGYTSYEIDFKNPNAKEKIEDWKNENFKNKEIGEEVGSATLAKILFGFNYNKEFKDSNYYLSQTGEYYVKLSGKYATTLKDNTGYRVFKNDDFYFFDTAKNEAGQNQTSDFFQAKQKVNTLTENDVVDVYVKCFNLTYSFDALPDRMFTYLTEGNVSTIINQQNYTANISGLTCKELFQSNSFILSNKGINIEGNTESSQTLPEDAITFDSFYFINHINEIPLYIGKVK
jgi:hypothetical protein